MYCSRLVVLIKNIYPLWGRKRFHLPIVGSETLPSACWGRKRFHLPVTWGRKRFLLGIITLSETLPSACYTPSTCYILSYESSIPFYSMSKG